MPVSAATALPAFDLHELRATGGELRVTGTWSGVRGMRFVRPTLTVGGRRLLATLEHKPWAPDADPWTATFPWDGGEVDVDDAVLSVAPTITVTLGEGGPPAAAEPEDPIVVERRRFDRRETEIGFLRDELRAAREERDRAQARTEALERERDDAVAAVEQAERRFERAARQRDEARDERDAARAALETERRAHGEDVRRRDEAVARAAEAEEDREEVRRQRDAAALAYRALEQRRREPAAMSREAGTAPAVGEDGEEPIGVRTLPAITPETSELLHAQRGTAGLTEMDLLAFRFFGGIAAIAFVVLLISLLRAIA